MTGHKPFKTLTDKMSPKSWARAEAKAKRIGHPPRLDISVGKDAIERACERNSNSCMVAEAIKDKGFKYVAVDIQTIRATDLKKRERYVWLTPRSIQERIVQFDRGERPEPFSFTLRSGQTVPVAEHTERTAAYKKKSAAKKKRQLRMPKEGTATSVPVRVGGRTPPKAIGSRREFGLRAFQS